MEADSDASDDEDADTDEDDDDDEEEKGTIHSIIRSFIPSFVHNKCFLYCLWHGLSFLLSPAKKKKRQKNPLPSDVNEGRTIFIR